MLTTHFELPATAIYFLRWLKDAQDTGTLFGHVVVNAVDGDDYDSGKHVYKKGMESWWSPDEDLATSLAGAWGIKIVVEHVASALKDLGQEIQGLEAYTTWRFDAKSVLVEADWKQGLGNYSGSTFAGKDTDPSFDVCVRIPTDANKQLANAVWYAKDPFDGTYFGGKPKKGDFITLAQVKSGDPGWPGNDWSHFPCVP